MMEGFCCGSCMPVDICDSCVRKAPLGWPSTSGGWHLPRSVQRRLPRLVDAPKVVSKRFWGLRGVSRSLLERFWDDFSLLSEPPWMRLVRRRTRNQ